MCGKTKFLLLFCKIENCLQEQFAKTPGFPHLDFLLVARFMNPPFENDNIKKSFAGKSHNASLKQIRTKTERGNFKSQICFFLYKMMSSSSERSRLFITNWLNDDKNRTI